jgi:hypothetical protein
VTRLLAAYHAAKTSAEADANPGDDRNSHHLEKEMIRALNLSAVQNEEKSCRYNYWRQQKKRTPRH